MPGVTTEEQREADDDINSFVKGIAQSDRTLKGNMDKDQIFEDNPIKLEAARRAIELQQQAKDMRSKGNEYMKSKEFNEALNCYEKALQLDPKDAACHSNKAMAYLKLKNYPKVITEATKALDLQPGYIKALHRRGKAYYSTGNAKLAIKDF